MRVVSVNQNGKEWREWRGRGLGASDAPIIMGESKWCTPFEFWLDRTGLLKRATPNEFQVKAMNEGVVAEPLIRAKFEKEIGKPFPTLSAEHPEHEFMRASFDGINEELQAICEIKLASEVDHATAKKGKVPKHYYAQVQQQLLVSGYSTCYYVSGTRKDDLVIVPVSPDPAYQARLVEAVVDMWKRIQLKQLPDVSNRDILELVEVMEEKMTGVNNIVQVFKLLGGGK